MSDSDRRLSRFAAREARLAVVLAGVRFPAHRWELIACALDEAWDVVSVREMESLPTGVYRDIWQVVRMLTRDDRNDPAPPPRADDRSASAET